MARILTENRLNQVGIAFKVFSGRRVLLRETPRIPVAVRTEDRRRELQADQSSVLHRLAWLVFATPCPASRAARDAPAEHALRNNPACPRIDRAARPRAAF